MPRTIRLLLCSWVLLASSSLASTSGAQTIKALGFDVAGVLPSAEPDIQFSNSSAQAEGDVFAVSAGLLQQTTFGQGIGNVSYNFPNNSATGGGLNPAYKTIVEARLSISAIEGTGGAHFQAFDGVYQYSVVFLSGGLEIPTQSGNDFVAIGDLSLTRTYRLESPGNSASLVLYVDDVPVYATSEAETSALNGATIGDGMTATGNNADVTWDYIVVHQDREAVTFYTDEAAFTAAVGASAIDSLDTTGANIALADEVVSAPAQDAQLGSQLTFDAATTGLCASFVVQAVETGAGFTFDDGEPSPSVFPADSLSIGDIADFIDDDFRIVFPTAAVHAVGFFFIDSAPEDSEGFEVFGANGLLGNFPGNRIPSSFGLGSTFLGVVASEPIVSVRFDEDLSQDDIAIRDFRLGCANEDADSDGLSNLAEQRAGTDPIDSDTDDDGLLDGAEIGTGSFGGQQVISTLAFGAASVFAADVDSDGDLDVLSASESDDEVAWYENTDGAGSFGTQQIISTDGNAVQNVHAADLDGDGDVDVVAAAFFDNGVGWYENTDGAGSFGGQQVITVFASRATFSFVADVDGDGDLDVLSSSRDDDEIAWYENTDGAGTFGSQQVITNLADQAKAVFAADLDGDGDIDALSASTADDEIAWYENTDGAGSFGAQQVISTLADGAYIVIAEDVDGDGDTDVLSSSTLDDKIAWYENTDGAGSFGAQQLISTLAFAPRQIHAADVDGDGDVDVLSISVGDNEIAWYENTDGAGSFATRQVISGLLNNARGVFAADVDGDGDLDALSASGDDSKIAWYEQTNVADPLDADSDDDGLLDGFEVTYGFDPLDSDEDMNGTVDGQDDEDSDGLGNAAEQLAGTDPNDDDTDDDGALDGVELGTGIFAAPQTISVVSGGARSVVAADLDGDGDNDVLVAAQTDDEIEWYENTDGVGSFGAEQVISSQTVTAQWVSAADLDNDGDLDVLSSSSGDDKIAWYENTDGLGGFGDQQVITTLADGPREVVAADVDGDGDLDVLSASLDDDEVAWYENIDGMGTFGDQQVITTLADGARSVVAVDMDDDGDLDVLAGSFEDDEIAWYENTDGEGSFGSQQIISTAADGVGATFALDVDGDGDADVASASANDDEIAWYENTDGMGAFGTQQLVSNLADFTFSVIGADVDGDGDVDLLSASIDDDELAWYENTDGAGGFGSQQVISTAGAGAVNVYAADIDGDGDLDAVLAAFDENTVLWYEQTNVADPLDPDSDDDGVLDGAEIAAGTGPFDSDSDDDGLSDGDEAVLAADPLDPDTDADGVCDGGLTVGGTCTAGPDNCPHLPGAQTNSDALYAGDACQCGDVSDDGIVDATDFLKARQHVVGATITGDFDVTRCNLIGPEDAGVTDCAVSDLAVLARQVNGHPMSLANQAACDAWGAP